LIAETAQGAKFDLAVSGPNIRIVTPSWLFACSKSGQRVDEAPYLFTGTTKPNKPPSILSQLDELLAGPLELRSLFEFRRFYLLGFEEDIEMKQKLGRLIRRGKGTIYWEMNEDIGMMIMHATCEDSLR
jgi:hypothetical protein